MHITRARPDDAATLTDIAFAAKRHWGYPMSWIENWRDVLIVRPEFVAGHETYAAIDAGRAVGFHALGRKGCSVWNTALVLMVSLAEKPLTGEPDAGNSPVRF